MKRPYAHFFIKVILFFLLHQHFLAAQTDSITITEVMIRPAAGGTVDEFFEIYNFGSSSVDLTGWKVRDNNTTSTFVDSIGGHILNPGKFAVIFPSNYSVISGRYKDQIPVDALVLKTANSTIGNGLTDGGDSLKLINATNDTVSKYVWGNVSSQTPGFSHEKKVLNNDHSASNWTLSIVLNGTPGNYSELDLSIKKNRLIFNPAGPPTNSTVSITATIHNVAIRAVDSFKVKFFEDINKNYIADDSEELDSVSRFTRLNFADSATVSVNSAVLSSGKHIFIAKLFNISPNADTSLSNNTVIDSVSTIPAMDLSLTTSSLRFTPANPKAGDTLQILARIKNSGLTAASAFTVKFYEDINRNVISDETEFLDSVNFTGSLSIGDSVNVSIKVNGVTLGSHPYIVKLISASVTPLVDEVISNDQRVDSATVTLPDSITFSEVMFKPLSGEDVDEFFEIYNYGSRPVNLQNWRVRDNNTLDTLKNAGSGTVLNPGQFAVIFHQNYDLVNGFYKDIFPINALPLKVHSGLIGNGLGNSVDSLKLINSINDTVTQYAWSVSSSFPSGISHEKKVLNNNNSPSNWANGISVNGTPGSVNSVTPKQLDLSVSASDMNLSPPNPYPGQVFLISVKISNIGQKPSGSFTINLYRYFETDSLLLTSFNSPGLDSGSFIFINSADTALTLGQRAVAQIVYTSDENPLNNSAFKSVVFGAKRYSVVINEINYQPSSNSTEWIELYNPGADSINLKKWKWSDEVNFSSPKTITTSDFWIRSGEFLVIAKDSLLFNTLYAFAPGRKIFMGSGFSSLNNSGDLVALFDSLGGIVDSLFYESSWGGETDASLERIFADSSSTDRVNWRTSEAVLRATPGQINSRTPVPLDIAINTNDVFFTPPHPAVHQPVTITVIVRNKGLQNVNSSFKIKTYYDANNNQLGETTELLDSTVVNSLLLGDSVSVSISWTVPSDLPKRHSILGESRFFLVRVEYPDDQRIENNTVRKELKIGIQNQSVVINEIMYDPDTSKVEFAEIYNLSSVTLNLQNWTFSDASSSKIITAQNHFFNPQQFRVLTGDSSFFRKFPSVPDSFVIVIPSMPALNNTDDKVIIRDDVGNAIDSLHYYSSWGGKKSKSLERRSYTSYSDDPANWATCLSSANATPASVNSILLVQSYERNTLLINEIMYSPFSGEPEYVEIYNPADTAVNLLNWSMQVGSSKAVIVSDNLWIPAGEYAVLAENNNFSNRFDLPNSKILLTESTFPTLSNSGSTIQLLDLTGSVIDSVNYKPQWGGGTGISLERIRPGGDANSSQNWGSCVFIEGGTPGNINSNFAGSLQKKIKISATPNPFLVDQGEHTRISIDLPVTQARITVKIYDNQGRLMNTLLNNSLSGNHREIIWDGKDRDKHIARMGIYIIYVEAIDALSGFNKSAKQTVVLGRKL